MAALRILLCVLLYAVDVFGQYSKTERACYGTTDCNWMTLDCHQDGYVFIMKMQYGFKLPNDSCISTPRCTDCCQPGPLDCFSNYSQQNFGDVYVNGPCWHTRTCTTQALRTEEGCPQHHKPSTFAVADYVCLRGAYITDFSVISTTTAPAVAVHYDGQNTADYNDREDSQTWFCLVDTANFVQRQADVILVKESYTGNSDKCSSVGWSGGLFLPCVPDFQYKSFVTPTPFCVSVRVRGNSRSPNGWAVVRSQSGENLVVTCGNKEENFPTTCPDEMAPTTTSSLGNSEAEATKGSNTGAVVGGVVAAVGLLTAAVLAVFCYVKRRRAMADTKTSAPDKPKTSKRVPMALSSGSAAPPTTDPSPSAASGTVNPGVCNPALQNAPGRTGNGKAASDVGQGYTNVKKRSKDPSGQATAPGLHGNARSPAEDPDYDLLGQKKSQSSSSNPAATYGRLGEVGGGGEDTDYNYDHLARGDQAALVINSDYDTSVLNMASEGDYNVAGIPRRQHVITGSDYDVAEIVASEGDYNRVDFHGRNQKVITGSDYNVAELVTSDKAE